MPLYTAVSHKNGHFALHTVFAINDDNAQAELYADDDILLITDEEGLSELYREIGKFLFVKKN